MKLKDELLLFGASVPDADFEDVLVRVHANANASRTTEQLLYHPDEAKVFCHAVRARCGLGLPDEMILRRLQNVRKKGELTKSKAKNGRKK